jgi:hypothetical protein
MRAWKKALSYAGMCVCVCACVWEGGGNALSSAGVYSSLAVSPLPPSHGNPPQSVTPAPLPPPPYPPPHRELFQLLLLRLHSLASAAASFSSSMLHLLVLMLHLHTSLWTRSTPTCTFSFLFCPPLPHVFLTLATGAVLHTMCACASIHTLSVPRPPTNSEKDADE